MRTLSMLCSELVALLKRSSIILACLAACCPNDLRLNAQILTWGDLQRETAEYEAASHGADPSHMSALEAGRIWLHLGILYQDAGRYGQSEMAYKHAMRLLTIAPVSRPNLADAIDNLGTLYMETGNLKGAEDAESKAMKMREAIGLESELPQSWYHLATLYLRERRADKSRSYAQRAFDAFSNDMNAFPEDKVGTLLVLSASLCQSHRYPEAIAHLQAASQLSNDLYGPEQFPTGLNTFLLGYVYWKSGDLVSASKLMQHGSDILGKTLGWHPTYLFVLTQYAHFLRDAHERDAAHAIEQEIKQKRAHFDAEPTYSQKLQTIDIAALFE
jgi:tetratricopeptide (TPR) repeat protein